MVRRLMIIALGLLVAGALAAGVSWHRMQTYLDSPLAIDVATEFTIPSGATMRAVVDELVGQGITDTAHWLLIDARLNESGGQIKAGDYILEPGTTPRQMMATFIAGDVKLERVTLIEGWTAAEALAAILGHEAVRDDLDIALTKRADGTPWLEPDTHRTLASRLDIEGASIEGWLYPDTYRFARGTAASALLAQAHAAMTEALDAAWAEAGEGAQLESAYAALTLASIIEKETALDSERGRIAGVFSRRLARGMRLETDPTVIYGMGLDYDGNIRRRDLRETTAYNTYRIDGLPPTPIALPARASIEAALAPVEGEALFFVATGDPDGSHYFSATLDEHNEAVQRYLSKLRQRP
ncbi:MAG: endolytic transglycosylase MltG [Pseudomonadota bacterium]